MRQSGHADFSHATAGSVWMMSPNELGLSTSSVRGITRHLGRRYFPMASRSASRFGRPAARIFFCAVWMSYSSRRSSTKFLSVW